MITINFLTLLGWVGGFSGIVMILSFIIIETYFWRRKQYIKSIMNDYLKTKEYECRKFNPKKVSEHKV